MNRILITLVFMLSSVVLAQELTEYKSANIDGIDGVIVPKEAAYYLTTDQNVSGYWTVQKKDLEGLELQIQKYLSANPPSASPPLWKKFPSYKRQYVGIIVEGNKRIFINFLCQALDIPDWETNWKNSPVMVLDGGDCYFQVLYDIDSKSVLHVYVNGEA